jgi:hypothetical protein
MQSVSVCGVLARLWNVGRLPARTELKEHGIEGTDHELPDLSVSVRGQNDLMLQRPYVK